MNVADHHLKLLCVDSDDDARVIVELALRLDPHLDVVSAPDPLKAISALGSAVLADAIIIGADLLTIDPKSVDALRQRVGGWHVPIITVSARHNAVEIHEQDALKNGVVGNIIRPFDPLTLADKVRSLLSETIGARIQ